MINVSAQNSAMFEFCVPQVFRKFTLMTAPFAATCLYEVFSRTRNLAQVNSTAQRLSPFFQREIPRFTEPHLTSFSSPLVWGVLILGTGIIIHELLNRNGIHPSNPQMARIPQLPLLPP